MRRWMILGAVLTALTAPALAGCEEEVDEGALELEERTEEATEEPVVTDEVRPSAGATQHPPPEGVEVEPSELPEDRVAGAAQHPLPEGVREE